MDFIVSGCFYQEIFDLLISSDLPHLCSQSHRWWEYDGLNLIEEFGKAIQKLEINQDWSYSKTKMIKFKENRKIDKNFKIEKKVEQWQKFWIDKSKICSPGVHLLFQFFPCCKITWSQFWLDQTPFCIQLITIIRISGCFNKKLLINQLKSLEIN